MQHLAFTRFKVRQLIALLAHLKKKCRILSYKQRKHFPSPNATVEKNKAYIFKLTLFKVVNDLTDTISTQSCNVCNAKPNEIKLYSDFV